MKLEWEVLELEPEHPFTISRSTKRRVRRVWVRVRHGSREGWGEADPSDYYGEDAGTTVEALEGLRPVVEAAGAPEAFVPLGRALGRRARELAAGSGGAAPEHGRRAADDAPGVAPAGAATRADASVPPDRRAPHAAARAGITAACLDLWGKRLDRPLWRLWGLDPAEAPVSSFTLGLDEPEVMARKARAARGWPVLKVKLGAGREREEAVMEAVRSEAPDATIRVDANAGWTAEEAVERVRWLADLGVEFVEQPLPPDDREGYRRVREASPVPIVADESCVVPADVPPLAGAVDGVNVKLAKCGGPLAALRTIHTARACGLKVMLGCMLETSLGVAPAAHLAPLVDWADLDGAHLLAEDPFRGPGPVAPEAERAAGDGAARRVGGSGETSGAPGTREEREVGSAAPGSVALGGAPGLGVRRR